MKIQLKGKLSNTLVFTLSITLAFTYTFTLAITLSLSSPMAFISALTMLLSFAFVFLLKRRQLNAPVHFKLRLLLDQNHLLEHLAVTSLYTGVALVTREQLYA